jgi:FAD/FMN-containing dehydrogenase
MAGVEEVQQDSLWMKVQAGTRLSEAAKTARRHGCRLAGTADSGSSTVGGWLSTRSAIRDWILGIYQPPVLSLEAVLPTGNLVHSVSSPRSATGPDLFSLLLGTWGGFGVITRATVKLEPLPEHKEQAEINFPSTKKAVELLQNTVVRTYPPSQAMVVIEKADEWRKAKAYLTFEGQREVALTGIATARRLAKESGGRDAAPGTKAVRPGGEFLQTGVRWSGLIGLLQAVDQEFSDHQRAIIDRPGLHGCRLRLDLPDTEENRRTLGKFLDPDGSESSSLTSARNLLSRIRNELDPAGLVNPHAWPLPWPGGSL